MSTDFQTNTNEYKPLTTVEWQKKQTIQPPDKCYYVKSETTIDTVYTIQGLFAPKYFGRTK